MKNEKNQYAYSDALINVLEEDKKIDSKILIVDEAQDLFPTQIKIIQSWLKQENIDYFVLSGDDDQCVHEWAGSDPKFIIETPCDEEIILEKSYRCPEKVCVLANKMLSKINYRKEKWLKSQKQEGEIKIIDYADFKTIVSNIDLKEKTFFLFRANKLKNAFAQLLFERTTIPYGFIDDKGSSPYTFKYVNTHNAIIKLSQGKNLVYDEIAYLIDSIKTDQLIRGIKTGFKKDKENEKKEFDLTYFLRFVVKWSLKVYDPNFNIKEEILASLEYNRVSGKNQDKKLSKNQLIVEKIRASDSIIAFKKVITDKGIKIAALPLSLGTFHASKGLEAESVTVFLGTSSYFRVIDDTEWRCLYVATTRTRNKLFFVNTGFLNEDYALYDAFKSL